LIKLDHIAVWCNNLYETTIRLSKETGIGHTDGGYFPKLGLGQKVISLGDYVYIEVESIVDHKMIANREDMALEPEKQTANGDCFSGLCFRTDEMVELEAFARHLNAQVATNISGGKVRPVERGVFSVAHVPTFWNSWRLGKPNLYYIPDLEYHPSLMPIQSDTGTVKGTGVTSIEVGGTKADMQSWFGDVLDLDDLEFEVQYNGAADGLYAVTFGTADGEKTIRLNPITL
jgi:hypothetical protein